MVHCYLDTGDAKSTGNLRKHAKVCWGEEMVAAADQTRHVEAAREALKKRKDGSITEAFERVAKGEGVLQSLPAHNNRGSVHISLPHYLRPDLK